MLLSADGEVCPEVGLLLLSSDSVSSEVLPWP